MQKNWIDLFHDMIIAIIIIVLLNVIHLIFYNEDTLYLTDKVKRMKYYPFVLAIWVKSKAKNDAM